MKNNYIFLLLVLFVFCLPCLSHGQGDTIRVQTFVWDSPNRSDVFQFPDDPTESYRKIWMKYNMRCHNNEVGNGAVGCREWDYSCNTFITDSTRVDSTRQMHPSHVISNFSQDTFEYTTQTAFQHYQYLQHLTSIDFTNETSASIGNGNLEMVLSGSQPTARAQFLYLATELSDAGLAAGEIQALDLVPAQQGTIGFMRLRLKETVKPELNAEEPDLDGFTEVYFSDTEISPGAAHRFNFYQPFVWDGVSNLIVETSFTHEPTGQTPSILASPTAFTSSVFSGTTDYALHFAGTGEVDIPAEKFANVSNEITVSLWCKGIPETMPANSTIFEGRDDNGNRQVNVHLPWSNGQVYWDCGNDGSGYDRINKTANEEDYEGQWNHWAFTKNATTGDMKIYLNGELWHAGTGLTKPIVVTDFELASSVTGGSAYFGSVDEFRVWDKELEATEIKDWMSKQITPDHPNFASLVAYFQLDEGMGSFVTDEVGAPEAVVSLPNWQRTRGKDLYKNFLSANLRPNISFLQGDAVVTDELVSVIDLVPLPQHQVLYYDINGSDLVLTDTQYFYPAGNSYVLSAEDGSIVDSIWVAPENTIAINSLTYYDKRPAKFEILSLVTPYGNGLSLGFWGKTFTFDVTDYAPILKGLKRMSIEMGGQWQEDLDIEFIFIKGLPPRPVLNIQNIWPFRRGGFGDIQTDRYFEPRSVLLAANGERYKLRSAITGHGQNGEFVPREHYLDLDGGDQEFTFDVWKECADNPIYPQGGTWIFDRAGWCPGAATDVREFDITDLVDQGGEVEFDYGVNGAHMGSANYLVSNQLVTYGEFEFAVDASLERIIRPSSTDVEYERINPSCQNPKILVENTGVVVITDLQIQYNVKGSSNVKTYDWIGEILPNEQVEIELPLTSMSFWATTGEQIFEARIIYVNFGLDEYSINDMAQSEFELVDVYGADNEYFLRTETNNFGSEYSYTIKNISGEILMSRDNMADNTTYEDTFELPPGCYTLKFDDSGHDGLSFWFFPENGNGNLAIRRVINTFDIPQEIFNPDFGSGVQFDFVIEEPVASNEVTEFRAISTYPNPASDGVNLELRGFDGTAVEISLYNLQGQPVQLLPKSKIYTSEWKTNLDLTALPSGMYFMKVKSEDKVWVKEVVKL